LIEISGGGYCATGRINGDDVHAGVFIGGIIGLMMSRR